MSYVNCLPLFNTAGRAKLAASHPHSLSIFMKPWLNYVILCYDGDSESEAGLDSRIIILIRLSRKDRRRNIFRKSAFGKTVNRIVSLGYF
jgi:hypothetical protein